MTDRSSTQWLLNLLKRAVAKDGGMCVKVACTTCGAGQFLTALRCEAQVAAWSVSAPPLEPAAINALVQALAARRDAADNAWWLAPPFKPDTVSALVQALAALDTPRRFQMALRLVLFELWVVLDEDAFHNCVESRVEGTPVGRFLDEMRAHSAAVEHRRLEHEAEAAAGAARREEGRRQRQAAHEERRRAKPARDAAWFARKAQASTE